MAVLIVYPIKYGPVGNSIAPITSPNTFINIVHFGPNHIAQSIVGINAKLIFIIGVFIDRILDKIINRANNIDDNIIFLFFDIKKLPFFLFFRNKRKEDYILLKNFFLFLAECENK